MVTRFWTYAWHKYFHTSNIKHLPLISYLHKIWYIWSLCKFPTKRHSPWNYSTILWSSQQVIYILFKKKQLIKLRYEGTTEGQMVAVVGLVVPPLDIELWRVVGNGVCWHFHRSCRGFRVFVPVHQNNNNALHINPNFWDTTR